MVRLIIGGLLLILGSATFWVYQPDLLGQAVPSVSHSGSLSPSERPQVHSPSGGITEAPTASQRATGPLPEVSLPAVPSIPLEPTFLPIPTATPKLPPVPSVPDLGEGCYQVPVTANTPTGVAGCVRFGEGIASFYQGTGAAMNFCTWSRRQNQGCGSVTVTAGLLSVRLPVTDFCDCFTGTDDERIIDLPVGSLPLLGLNPAEGLFRVTVER